jgi:hypothetical protein
VIKSRRMRCGGHAWERWEMHTKSWSGNVNGRDLSKDLGKDEKIT